MRVLFNGILSANGRLSGNISIEPEVPTKVTGVSLSVESATEINITWNEATGDEPITYDVYRGTISESLAEIATGITGTSYSDTGLTASTEYFYQVRAVNSAGNGEFSDETNATTNTVTQPSELNKVVINTVSNGSANNPHGYIEYLPEDYDTRNDWPLLIHYPGGGETGDGSLSDLNKILNTQISNRLNNGLELPWIVLSPQSESASFGAGQLQQFLEWARENYLNKIDDKQVHISVISGSGSQGLDELLEDGTYNYSHLNSISYLSSGGNPSSGSVAYDNIVDNNIRTWFHHGTSDGAVGIASKYFYFERIHEVFGSGDTDIHRFTAYTGVGHSTWNLVYEGAGITTSQETGNIPNTTEPLQYYQWNAGTWYSWMLEKTAAKGSFLTVPANPTENESVQFNADIVYADSVLWDFGDGSTSTQENPTHTYTTDGTFTVTLTLTNRFGDDTIITDSVIVLPATLTENKRAKLDMSSSNTAFDSTWNAVTGDPHLGTADVANLNDSGGTATGWSITYNQSDWIPRNGDTGNNNNGPSTGNNSGVYPDSVMQGYHFSEEDGGSAEFTIGGLNQSNAYTFVFYAGRQAQGSSMRETTFSIGGIDKPLNIFQDDGGGNFTVGNTTETVSFENLVPDSNGEIVVTLKETGSSRFLYINAMEIIEFT